MINHGYRWYGFGYEKGFAHDRVVGKPFFSLAAPEAFEAGAYFSCSPSWNRRFRI